MLTISKTKWMRVPGAEKHVEYQAVENKGMWTVEVTRYGGLYLEWQDLTDASSYWTDRAFNENGELCPWQSLELADMKHILTCNLKSYLGDKTGAERLKECVAMTQGTALGLALIKIEYQGLPKELQRLLCDALMEIIKGWAVRLTVKCGDEYLARYGL